eukprot:11103293-Karenia_brevis.AAC.1
MVHQRSKTAPSSSSRPAETVKQWEARKASVHRRQVRRHMADAKHKAAKAETRHKARLRRVLAQTKAKR